MELRQIIGIFEKNISLFFGTVVVFALCGLAFFALQPEVYEANLTLNVTRKGVQDTQDYRYDGFYRLQADERFADTVVRWIGSPQISKEIFEGAKVSSRGPIEARRLSSQMIEVVFSLGKESDAEKIAASASEVLNRQAEKLDESQKENTWFVLVADEPFVAEKKIGLAVSFSASLLLGLFFAFWSVMIANYLKRG
ncbi:MAG: hypothetical protein UY41_C0018G0007 [Candidatus Moranbacteria bacterium GW2011_GWE1_49_15]|nr:MAG: hypothetical protein UX75_C0051G0003 [Candidatus Moranbacteria bacterium GW2011_GWE2_47_10]KKW06649.1 MAG: hypothetical protein UY41_C0018G0007 [Candidatus Moranbacteria bacterium GW2011_GWE1_49_15]HBP00701.1 hypothetical protein [Candidatus Moranbacteria bacterium]